MVPKTKDQRSYFLMCVWISSWRASVSPYQLPLVKHNKGHHVPNSLFLQVCLSNNLVFTRLNSILQFLESKQTFTARCFIIFYFTFLFTLTSRQIKNSRFCPFNRAKKCRTHFELSTSWVQQVPCVYHNYSNMAPRVTDSILHMKSLNPKAPSRSISKWTSFFSFSWVGSFERLLTTHKLPFAMKANPLVRQSSQNVPQETSKFM